MPQLPHLFVCGISSVKIFPNKLENKGGDQMASENLYWIWLSECLGVASKHLIPLIEKFESPYEIYSLAEDEIVLSGVVPESVAKRLADKSLSTAYGIMDSCTAGNIGILSYSDRFYHSLFHKSISIIVSWLNKVVKYSSGMSVGDS